MVDFKKMLIILVELWQKEMNISLLDCDKVLVLTELNTDDKIITFISYFEILWKENNMPKTNYEMMNLVCKVARENSYPNATELEIRKDLKLDELPAFPEEINEMSVKEKMHWVAEKVNGLGLYPNVMGKSIAKTEMLEKAYKLFKENPDISKEDYLDIMGLEE